MPGQAVGQLGHGLLKAEINPRRGQLIAHFPQFPDHYLCGLFRDGKVPVHSFAVSRHSGQANLLDHGGDVLDRAVMKLPCNAGFFPLLNPDDVIHVPVPQECPFHGGPGKPVKNRSQASDFADRHRVGKGWQILAPPEDFDFSDKVPERDDEPFPEGPEGKKNSDAHEKNQYGPEAPNPNQGTEKLVPGHCCDDIPVSAAYGVDRDGIKIAVPVLNLHRPPYGYVRAPDGRQIVSSR
ncbi:hypothetical protein SDC9_60559 [bioreactor metagenome]|uniref:Uncharacterized protein n=1 Tax=bioreactor metagenome TaxID=1076179 RepID=A0A644XDM4_9ZZZZ